MQALFKSKSGYVTSLLHFTLEHELLGSKAALFDVLLILVRSGLKKELLKSVRPERRKDGQINIKIFKASNALLELS